jgi:hypothetical protein
VALSLAFLGFAYLLLSRQDAVILQPFTRLGVVVSATFGVVAATCFIIPPTLARLSQLEGLRGSKAG